MKYSKNEINRAGLVLINELASDKEKFEAMNVLEEFRMLHILPLSNFRVLLDRKTKGYKNILVSQRLKRVSSIISKLETNPGMSLSRMQDVGGLRIVASTITDVYEIVKLIRMSENQPNFKSKFLRDYDYIKFEKKTGYRSYHLVYRYDNKCIIEIQVRTKVQHGWATAVEIMGSYLNEQLKRGIGDEKVLILFKDISHAFMIYESGGNNTNIYKKALQGIDGYKLIGKLSGFNVITKNVKIKKKRGQYFLIVLDLKSRILNVQQYTQKMLRDAMSRYRFLEMQYRKDENHDVVLVSAENIHKLRVLFPNYFLDTKLFIEYIDKIRKKNEKYNNLL